MSIRSDLYRRRTTTSEKENKESDLKEKKLIKTFQFQWLKEFCLFKQLEINSFESLIKILFTPTCSSSLGVVRALFGLMMIIDIPDERGLGRIDVKYGDPMRCHFPLFNWLSPLPVEYMGLLYTVMWLGALGICLGYKYEISCLLFTLPYWYIYLLDKTAWNNHSYLYGLVSILFTFTYANHSFSIDALLDPSIKNKPVPLWNYTIIRFQFFLLYFYAGVKKFDPDWIGGYSMTRLGLHWVFNPFRLVLNNDQIDFWIIHIFGFVFDLTVGFFLLIEKTRPIAIVFSTAFHLMNSCMFYIGQFPYVCLVTTPIFCSYDWPDQLRKYFSSVIFQIKNDEKSEKRSEEVKIKKTNSELNDIITWKHKFTCLLLGVYVIFQLFLPYSHFITKGYNNWTNGLYGYSWDMMVKNWASNMVVIRVIDNKSKEEFFLEPEKKEITQLPDYLLKRRYMCNICDLDREAWVGNTRYSKHGDMLVQYAQCLKRNLNTPEISRMRDIRLSPSFSDISIYIDVWCSLNGRFQQRMFDPRQDLLTAQWSPFKKISWLMPLLSELTPWRKHIKDIQNEVFQWSNYSDVQFVADFPGLHLENYISTDFTNVTVTVLQGTVVLEQLNGIRGNEIVNVTLCKGDSSSIKEGFFHKIYTVSDEPSYYMYTYNNYSMQKLGRIEQEEPDLATLIINDTFLENINRRVTNFWDSLFILQSCFNKLFFNIPMPKKSSQVE